MIYKSSGRLYFLLAHSLIRDLLGMGALVWGVWSLSSSQNSTASVVAIVSGVGILFFSRNDLKMVKEVELNGSQLTSRSLIGRGSIDLLSVSKIKLIGVVFGRYVPEDRLIEVSGDGKKAYIQLRNLNDNEKQQLWTAIGPYLLNPKVSAPKNFDGAVFLMGVKQVHSTPGITSPPPTPV